MNKIVQNNKMEQAKYMAKVTTCLMTLEEAKNKLISQKAKINMDKKNAINNIDKIKDYKLHVLKEDRIAYASSLPIVMYFLHPILAVGSIGLFLVIPPNIASIIFGTLTCSMPFQEPIFNYWIDKNIARRIKKAEKNEIKRRLKQNDEQIQKYGNDIQSINLALNRLTEGIKEIVDYLNVQYEEDKESQEKEYEESYDFSIEHEGQAIVASRSAYATAEQVVQYHK